MQEYDLVVIGAGAGGLVLATTANRKGLKTAMLEKNKIGGDCTHYGCIPSKSLLSIGKVLEESKHFEEKYSLKGLTISGEPDFSAVMEHVNEKIRKIYSKTTPEHFRKKGIDVFIDKTGARFVDEHTIQIGNELLKFKHAVIATGSSPQSLDIPGFDEVDVLNTVNFWEERKLPESIIFIGGGVIAAEMAQTLACFGTNITLVDTNPRILSMLDVEVGDVIRNVFHTMGIEMITGVNVESFRKSGMLSYMAYELNGEIKEISAEKIFCSPGRQPNIYGIGLEKAGIEFTEKGVKTNKYLQTSKPHIYACGDITVPFKFTHKASYQAHNIIDNILHDNIKENDLSAMPWVIFTAPEIAHVGYSEVEAREKFGDSIQVFKVNAETDRFITENDTRGFLKVIFDEDDRVIGADAIGSQAGEWIHIITIAIHQKIPVQEFQDMIFAYPTFSEIVKKAFVRFSRSKEHDLSYHTHV